MKHNLTSKDGTKSFSKDVGKTIMTYRQSRELTQQQLADLVGLSVQQIQKYEYGETNISVTRLITIANAFDVCVLELLKPSLASYYDIDTIRLDFFADPLDIKLATLLKNLDLKRKQNLLNLLSN